VHIYNDWTALAQERHRRLAVVNTLMNNGIPYKDILLTGWATNSFTGRTRIHGIGSIMDLSMIVITS
jgi:hypothetical protein